MSFTYKNHNTGDLVTLPAPSKRLDSLDVWTRVSEGDTDGDQQYTVTISDQGVLTIDGNVQTATVSDLVSLGLASDAFTFNTDAFDLKTDSTPTESTGNTGDAGTATSTEDAPTKDWLNPDIEKWAAAHDIELDGKTKKADMLAVIKTALSKQG